MEFTFCHQLCVILAFQSGSTNICAIRVVKVGNGFGLNFYSCKHLFSFQLFLWIGGQYINHSWLWLDGAAISTMNMGGFPLWGEFQPIHNEVLKHILLTNSLEYSMLNADNKRQIVWTTSYPYFEIGYICERTGNEDRNWGVL